MISERSGIDQASKVQNKRVVHSMKSKKAFSGMSFDPQAGDKTMEK